MEVADEKRRPNLVVVPLCLSVQKRYRERHVKYLS